MRFTKAAILQFLRLPEKAQSSSKPTAFEKEPLALEEGQSKCYLSYPRLAVLDMKRGNHEINVVEWANIPNFPPLLNGY